MTSSLVTSSDQLPHWAQPTASPPQPITVGINANAQFYPYDHQQVILPELRGAIVGLRLIQQGGNTNSGPRDYLEVNMISDVPVQLFRLRLPAQRPADGGTSLPNSVRSLLGALLVLDLTAQAVKLTARKGGGRSNDRKPTFINVCACGPNWESVSQVRAEPIGNTRSDMLQAIAIINESLHPHGPNPV